MRKFHQIHRPLGDVDRLVADSLQIGVDLGDRENKAQIHGDRLLQGEQIEGQFVDFPLGDVDLEFAFEHHVAARQVAVNVRLAGAIHGLLGQSAHAKQTCSKIVQSLLKAGAHYPNLPVM